jgi:hypothetical protein
MAKFDSLAKFSAFETIHKFKAFSAMTRILGVGRVDGYKI